MGKEKRPFFCHNCFVPNELSALAWGLYTCEKKHIKMVKNQNFKEIFFKLSTYGQSDKEFLLTSKFCPQRVVCPCPGAIYMYEIILMCLKSYFKEIVLKLATKGFL